MIQNKSSDDVMDNEIDSHSCFEDTETIVQFDTNEDITGKTFGDDENKKTYSGYFRPFGTRYLAFYEQPLTVISNMYNQLRV